MLVEGQSERVWSRIQLVRIFLEWWWTQVSCMYLLLAV